MALCKVDICMQRAQLQKIAVDNLSHVFTIKVVSGVPTLQDQGTTQRDNHYMFLSDDEEEEAAEQPTDKTFDPTEIANTIKILSSKIEDLTTCNNLIVNHGTQLQRSLAELDHLQSGAAGDTSTKMKAINERATLFRITTNAMINVRI